MTTDLRSAGYWEQRYSEAKTGWDIGYASTPIVEYFEQLENKDLKILIPGCGNAYEAATLFEMGFKNIYLLDIAEAPLKKFQQDHPDFPKDHIIHDDFFEHDSTYDVIVEQTFFCAIDPSDRQKYVKKAFELLSKDGKLVGLLFNREFEGGPPFGGSKEEYRRDFAGYFDIKVMEEAYNSIKPRAGAELFVNFKKQQLKNP